MFSREESAVQREREREQYRKHFEAAQFIDVIINLINKLLHVVIQRVLRFVKIFVLPTISNCILRSYIINAVVTLR